jgi:8-oxo-dGTP pyrophosphatase MutT (NUDIX family)
METTCGIFLFIKNGKLLLGHITNTRDKWSIPKGLPDQGEELFEAAEREMYEETNIEYSKLKIVSVVNNQYTYYKNKKKKLFSLTVHTSNEEKDFDLKCNSFVNDPKGDFPEIDGYKFVTIKEALEMDIQESQKEILRNI